MYESPKYSRAKWALIDRGNLQLGCAGTSTRFEFLNSWICPALKGVTLFLVLMFGLKNKAVKLLSRAFCLPNQTNFM